MKDENSRSPTQEEVKILEKVAVGYFDRLIKENPELPLDVLRNTVETLCFIVIGGEVSRRKMALESNDRFVDRLSKVYTSTTE